MVRARVGVWSPGDGSGVNDRVSIVPDGEDDDGGLRPGSPAPIVWYGTSIVNGHVASRPGMIFTHQLSRALGRSVVNLGFGGNGEMEWSVVRAIAELTQGAAVVIDCNWNMDPAHIRANASSVVRQLRAQWSGVAPIVLAEGTSAGAAWLVPAIQVAQLDRRSAPAAAFAELVVAGAPNLHYVHGDALLGTSGAVDLPTAMGTHPTDLGHTMIAAYYAATLPPILTGTVSPPDAATAAATAAADARQRLWVLALFPGIRADDAGQAAVVGGCGGTISTSNPAIRWTDAATLFVGGRADWGDAWRESWYDRFPLEAKSDVTSGRGGPDIWGLSKCTPGEFIGFALEGNVTSLWVNYSVHDGEHHQANRTLSESCSLLDWDDAECTPKSPQRCAQVLRCTPG